MTSPSLPDAEQENIPGKRIGEKIAQNGFWLLTQRALDLMLAFAFTWIALRRLGPENFGLITLTQAVLNLSSLFTLNLENSLVQIVPDLRKQGFLRSVRYIITFSYLIKLTLAFVFATLLFILAPNIASIYNQPVMALMIRIGCLSFFSAALAEVGAEANLSLMHPEIRTFVTTARRVVELTGLIIVTLTETMVWNVILVLAIADTVAFTGYLIAVIVFLRRLGRSNEGISLILLFVRMTRYAFPLLGARLAEVGGKELGKIILGTWISTTLLGFYSLARLVVERLIDLFSQLPLAAVPVISGEKNVSDENEVVHRLFIYQAMAGGLIAFSFFVLAYTFIGIVGGIEYMPAIHVVRISILVILFWSATAALHVNFLIHEKTHGILFLNGSQITVALIFYLILIPMFGEKGAAVADVLGQMVSLSLGLFFSYRWFGFPSLPSFKKYLSIVLPATLLMIPAFFVGTSQVLSVIWLVIGASLYIAYFLRQGFLDPVLDFKGKSPYLRGSMGVYARSIVSLLKGLRDWLQGFGAG